MTRLPTAQPATAAAAQLAAVRPAFLFGNFAIGCGVMITAGTLNDMSNSLQVSVSMVGQLIAIGAVVVGVGAPLLAGWVSGFDRRRLLSLSLLWYGIGHLLCIAVSSYAALWPLRALTMIAAAVFTPQAAAAIGYMAAPEQRGRSITYVFLGWSIASVLGVPLGTWVGETFGWRIAFAAVAALSLAAAVWVDMVTPNGVRPAALSARDWKSVFTHPVLMAMVSVTALQSAGLFTLFPYFAPYYKQVMGANAEQISLMFAWYGAFGFIGNALLSRSVDRVGAGRAVAVLLVLMSITLLLWPIAHTLVAVAVVLVPCALGGFAANSAQQARLSQAAPHLASALMALNTSAIYLGQAVGASGGAWTVARHGYGGLSWMGLAWVVAAIATSVWVSRRTTVVAHLA